MPFALIPVLSPEPDIGEDLYASLQVVLYNAVEQQVERMVHRVRRVESRRIRNGAQPICPRAQSEERSVLYPRKRGVDLDPSAGVGIRGRRKMLVASSGCSRHILVAIVAQGFQVWRCATSSMSRSMSP